MKMSSANSVEIREWLVIVKTMRETLAEMLHKGTLRSPSFQAETGYDLLILELL